MPSVGDDADFARDPRGSWSYEGFAARNTILSELRKVADAEQEVVPTTRQELAGLN
jgi:hypothetical protein